MEVPAPTAFGSGAKKKFITGRKNRVKCELGPENRV
jgi:hypothetical protein